MQEIILPVPLLNQPYKSLDCCITTMLMIMAYNKDYMTHEEALQNFPEINEIRTGITPATARFLVESGYDVSYTMQQPGLLNDLLKNKTEKDFDLIKQEIRKIPDSKENFHRQWEQILKFIKAGGKFSTSNPSLKDIDDYIEKRIPVRIGIKNSIFFNNPKNKFNHGILIVGKNDNQYLINDPDTKDKKPYWKNKKILEKAWRANGSLLLVATKK